MEQDTITMLPNGEVSSQFDQMMINFAMESIEWDAEGKKQMATSILLSEMNRLLYVAGYQFATSKIGKYHLIFTKGINGEEVDTEDVS